MAVHIPHGPGDLPVLPGRGAVLLPAGVGFAQDERQQLGEVDEIAQRIVLFQRAEQLVEEEFHPADRPGRRKPADLRPVQRVIAAVLALEMHPEQAPGVLLVGPVAVRAEAGDAQRLVVPQREGPALHLHDAAAAGTAQEDVFLNALAALAVMVGGMGKEAGVRQIQTAHQRMPDIVREGFGGQDDVGLPRKAVGFSFNLQFHTHSIAPPCKIVHHF